jgi:alcohol dehydrogenase (cytochrome c)
VKLKLSMVFGALALSLALWAADDIGWNSYGGNDAGWRYSELAQINTGNVARLVPKWIFQTRVPGEMEGSPLVKGGIMYLTASSNHAFALDLRTGHSIWHYSRTPPKPLDLCCGEVNRGFAVLGNKLFKTNIEDTLIALDIASGKPVWETMLGDYKKGYSGTIAPLVVKNKILVGTAGAEFGIRGFVDAYSPENGERLWRFYTVPGVGEPGSDTWSGDSHARGGGSTWITGTYDPELNLTYWGTGNPGPDMDGNVRRGDNLYTCSVVALDPDTGKLKWHFQFTPHDTHDWDAVADPVLADLTIGGRKVKALIQANRNGYFYALDRTNGKFLFARPYTTISWSKGIGPDGRPQVIDGLDPSHDGTKVCPGLGGGHNWQATSYSPLTGLYYFGSTDGCQNFYLNEGEFIEGEWYQLSGTKEVPGERSKGSFIAIDPATGEIRWKFEMIRNPSGGAMATAGGLVFIGDAHGNLIGFDGRTGKVLWRFQTGASINAPPVSYTFEGKQYIAIAAGTAVVMFGLP